MTIFGRLADRARQGAVLLGLGLAACGGGHDDPAGPTPQAAPPQPAATRTVTVLSVDECMHIGDNLDPGICPKNFSNGFAREGRLRFGVTGTVLEGKLTLHVADMGPIGGEVAVNGRTVLTMPGPLGSGTATATVPGPTFQLGTNELVIRAREDGGTVEDFQVDFLELVLTVPA